ncbi:MAG: FAD:protein FMN transferase [Planctomycetota bacterium]
MRDLGRRRFLRAFLGTAATGAGLGMGLPFSGGLSPRRLRAEEAGSRFVTRRAEFAALGMGVSIEAAHAVPELADQAIAAAKAEIERVDAVLSLYRPDSHLARLNERGVVERPDPYLVDVLKLAAQVSRQSDGAFDATVQPLWELYSQSRKSGGLPSDQAIVAARSRVDWRQVVFDSREVRLQSRGMAVTLNGIAQGFAADRAAAAMRRHGIEHALVDAGEVAAVGGKTDGESWVAGIQHPRREDAYAELARLSDRCLSTSGDYATRFSDDFRANHLFDPRTGRSPEHFASVSVLAPSAALADALSTAVFVLGPDRGMTLLRAHRNVDALLILKDQRVMRTPGFPA